ncbi:MAG TPA: hypothetical protein DDY79_10305 [Brevundimonas sp.]|nr:hypothetical protein [Brevundimonas sp.]
MASGIRLPVAVLSLAIIGIASWSVGARAGYGFAQRDAAEIMQDSSGNGYQKAAWREWMSGSQRYEPPGDLAALMTLAGGTIPDTGGMTTGDIWNGYQMRMQREFFRDAR